MPKGVINVITTGSSSTVGKILATHPIIKKISFTGSTGVGKVLASQCSSTLKKWVVCHWMKLTTGCRLSSEATRRSSVRETFYGRCRWR